MGIFSSKKVITVGTSVVRAIADDTLPNSVRSGGVKGMFSGDDQYIENVLEDVAAGLGVTTPRLYNYGKNKYIYGLPTGAILGSQGGSETMRLELERVTGQAVQIQYYHFGVFNNLHVGWVKLTSEHGYNPVNNQIDSLTAQVGQPVYLTNMAVVVTDASLAELENGSLAQWGAPANSRSQVTGNPIYDAALREVNALKPPIVFELDKGSTADYLRVEYEWIDPATKTNQKGSFRMNLLGYEEEADYHQVMYSLADGTVHYFIYKQGSGTYPAVEQIYDPKYDNNGSYLPFTYFRFNKINGAADKTTDWYKQSKTMLRNVGMDFEQVANAIDENPDIADVEQAMMIFAVPANTKNALEQKYLFDYFKQMRELTKNSPANDSKNFGSVFTAGLQNTIVIQDKRFKMTLSFRNITRKMVTGSIGKIGSYASGYSLLDDSEQGKEVGSNAVVIWVTKQNNHWYRKQVTETVYEEIRVFNLKMAYNIFQEYSAIADEDEEILLVPLDMSIVKTYSLPQREQLFARSMQYVFNSKIVTKVKWYQQGWFRIFMLVVAIVVTVLSYGSTWQSIGAALAAGTITVAAVVYMLAVGLIKYFIVAYAIKLFVRAVGPEFAFLVAIVAAVTGTYQAIEAGSISGAPWAKDLLSVSTGLTKGINLELQRDFGKLSAEADEFADFVDSENQRLKEAQDLLTSNNWLTPLVIFGEKPNDFYNRTVHSGNIGVQGLEAVSQYVDIALVLPTLSDTL